jgi:hypothetical protein
MGEGVHACLRALAAREGRTMSQQLVYMVKRDGGWRPEKYTCEAGHVTEGPPSGDPPDVCPRCSH